MAKSARIRARNNSKPVSTISAGSITPPTTTVSFSFRHLDPSHSKFNVTSKNADYFCKLFDRLKSISGFTAKEILQERSSALRAHPIDWSGTSEKNGFTNLNEQFKSYEPYQLSISSNEHGRIHGFFIGHIFYVVWLDPEHLLYSSK
ncbi:MULTISPECIES: hypothetical protein [Providencia]|uniref:hypothetical protein n=1 Tax=Providencia TaxID=586 RepID=UPI001C66308B|nr:MULTISPECIES: hypothetical protein [Providencia]URR23949.1 hypothetical protein L3Q80_05825 [Providencia rettgeri]WOC00870.1 hypothetical protein P3L55_06050 [Providencia sp. PROV046]